MRIDFYVLNSDSADVRLNFACRLIEKAFRQNHRIYIQCDDQKKAEAFDDLLWCFRDDSFIPHNLQGEGPMPPPPVQIGCGGKPSGFNDVLLNLSSNVPEFYPSFRRVIEVVCGDEKIMAITREHYKIYRQHGHLINTHKL